MFVANADPVLFGLDGSSDEQSLLHSYGSIGDACLSLPPLAFRDDNMFYLSVNPIPEVTASEDQNVYSCPVLLERIVSRTDISRANASREYSAAGSDEVWHEYVDSLVRSGLYQSASVSISDAVKEFMDGFAGDFSDRAFTLIPGDGLYVAFAGKMRSDETADILVGAVKEQIVGKYSGICRGFGSWRERMQSWKNADVTFTLGNVASGFYLNDREPQADPGYSSNMEYTADGNGTVSVAGFGDNTGTFNTLSSVKVSYPDRNAGTDFSFDVPEGFTLWHGMNRKNTLTFNPLGSLGFISLDRTELFTASGIDMLRILSSLDGWKEDYMAVFEDIISEDSGYRGSLEDFSFDIRIPLCTEDNIEVSVTAE